MAQLTLTQMDLYQMKQQLRGGILMEELLILIILDQLKMNMVGGKYLMEKQI